MSCSTNREGTEQLGTGSHPGWVGSRGAVLARTRLDSLLHLLQSPVSLSTYWSGSVRAQGLEAGLAQGPGAPVTPPTAFGEHVSLELTLIGRIGFSSQVCPTDKDL